MNDDRFLSQALQRDVVRVALSEPPAPAEVTELRDFLGQSRQSPVLLYAKTAPTAQRAAAVLSSQQFVPVETNVILETTNPVPRRPLLADYRIRHAKASDAPAVLELARHSFRCSRFHTDPHIGTKLADAVKAAWADNFFRGERGDDMIVVEAEDTVAGFLLLLASSVDATLTLDLLAVGVAHRRHGLASQLMAFAQAEYPHLPRLQTGTQLNNVAALTLYQKNGFREVSRQLVWHRHVAAVARTVPV